MADCVHDASERFAVCAHLLAKPDTYVVRFTGTAKEHDRLCEACAAEGATPELRHVCAACRDAASIEGASDSYLGTPGILVEPSTLWFDHAKPAPLPYPDFVDMQPVLGGDRDVWIGLGAGGVLVHLDFDRHTVRSLGHARADLLEPIEDRAQTLGLHLSRDARLAAVVQVTGRYGAVIDLETGRELWKLDRGDYHEQHCMFSCAFAEHGGRTVLVHATAWNRLDISDARTGELLTVRESPVYSREQRPAHYLDYFHCGLLVSPDQRWIAEHGWIWHPYGVVQTWRLDAWLGGNVWESEDGPTRKALAAASYFWDGPMCWLPGDRLATWGLGNDDPLLAAVRTWDVVTGRELGWFAGPRGDLVFDGEVLIALDGARGATAWNLERGTRLLEDVDLAARRYHPTAKTFLAFGKDGMTTSRLCGHAAHWSEGVIAELAQRIAAEQAFDELPVLGDALERAGCTDAELLAHCQQPGEHGSRCWALDRLRQK